MIAISLFIIIVMAGMGALLNANLLHSKSQSMRSIMDNLNFIMEDLSKNLRTGYNYYCITGKDTLIDVDYSKSGKDCWGIAFEHQDGIKDEPNDQWVYYIGPDMSIKDEPIAIWKSTTGPYDTSSFIKLTSDEIIIDATQSIFLITGAESPLEGNLEQPFVTIKLVGSIVYNNVVTPFSLQTSVSQRQVDI